VRCADVPLVGQADDTDGVKPRGDGGQGPDHQPLARKTADAVMEEKRVLRPMDLRKKGAQGVHIGGTIETIHRRPLVAARPLPRHPGGAYDKKREQPLREHRCGRWEGVDGGISHQLVLCLVQPVHEFGMAGGPIIEGHRAAFLSDLARVNCTCLLWRLASVSGCRKVAAEGSGMAPNVPQSPVYGH